jgi:hypothetical protein
MRFFARRDEEICTSTNSLIGNFFLSSGVPIRGWPVSGLPDPEYRWKPVNKPSLPCDGYERGSQCRRDHNRLGFAYQIGFARLFNRFPAQQPLEINDELLSFVAVQMNIDSEQISDYASWQHTVSEHQARIQQYLGLRPFGRRRYRHQSPGACQPHRMGKRHSLRPVCAQPGQHSLKPECCMAGMMTIRIPTSMWRIPQHM